MRPTIGRPPISILETRYPEQEEIRQSLITWCAKQTSLREAADELYCTYRELSNYRHGQRWIPQEIAEFLGFEMPPLRVIRKTRAVARDNVVGWALQLFKAVKGENDGDRRVAMRQLLMHVESYKQSFLGRETTNG